MDNLITMGEYQDFLNCPSAYSPADSQNIGAEMQKLSACTEVRTKDGNIQYLEIPCAFDLEASSFYEGEGKNRKKGACMYIWSFGIGGKVIIGRTWDELLYTLSNITLEMRISPERRLVCYVHNLDYDFQFFRKWLDWIRVFSLDERKPLYALSTDGIEFRCSYKLSGYSLGTVGENLKKYHVEKLKGDLDYSVARHSGTPLTTQEMQYVINDNRVVQAYIMECIEQEGSITKIPMTKTGYVRRYTREKCFGETKDSRLEYHKKLVQMRLSADEYYQLKRAFQGGFTHGSPFWVDRVVTDLDSEDIISDYPGCIVAEKFPMSASETIPIRTEQQFVENLRKYCCLFDIEFFNLESTFLFDNYISSSRCPVLEGEVLSNGRVVRASHVITTITEQDYIIISKCYRWDKKRIGTFRRYKRGYLPTPFVTAVLDLYQAKTELKGIAEHKEEYDKSKEMINSCYGMCVTDPIRDNIEYAENQWKSERDHISGIRQQAKKRIPLNTVKTELQKYNNSFNRHLFYPWGVWITAYARRNLWSAIFELGIDYVYSDTDCAKFRNGEKHMQFFKEYNEHMIRKLEAACKYHGIDPARIRPKTIKGEEKILGTWEFDGNYSRFKTEGAKRYIVEYSDKPENGKNRGKVQLTVSGVNKQVAVPYMLDKYGKDGIFDAFSNNLILPGEATGKLTHTYIDREIKTELIDFRGTPGKVYEKSVVHMEPASYSLSMARKFLEYVQNVRALYV